LRLDSEFLKKEYLSIYEILDKKECDKLAQVCSWITQGPNPVFSDSGIPCLTGRNINKGRVSYTNTDIVSTAEYENLKRFQLRIGDTLITLKGKGSIGKIGYVIDNRKAIFSRDIGIIRPNKIDSAYVNAFILSKYGTKLVERGETGGTGQSTLATSYLKNIDIPRVGIEKEIGELVISSENILSKSQQTYAKAENILLSEVGLEDFTPSTDPVNIKNFSKSFASSGRLDAEYYQRKYDDIENEIKKHNKTDTLNNLIIKIDTGEYSPEYFHKDEMEGLTFYIRSTNIKGGQVEFDDDYYVRRNEFVRIARKGAILTARVGSIGVFGEVREELNGAVYSDNVLCFYLPDTFIPSVYTLLFNTKVFFEMIDRLARGSVQQRLNQETLKDLIIPVIPYTQQQRIATLVEESFALKQQSGVLLDVAKRAIEIVIEENEAIALEFIKANS